MIRFIYTTVQKVWGHLEMSLFSMKTHMKLLAKLIGIIVKTLTRLKIQQIKEVLSLSTLFIFSKLNMCKYLYEHNKIQQLRQTEQVPQTCD